MLIAFLSDSHYQRFRRPITSTVVDTGQNTCYDNNRPIKCPETGGNFNGQDARYPGTGFSYKAIDTGIFSQKERGLVLAEYDPR